jgi:hypothetical protein
LVKKIAQSYLLMDVNNSPEHPVGSDCEEIVWLLATKPSPTRAIKAIGLLCPACSQKLRSFFGGDGPENVPDPKVMS